MHLRLLEEFERGAMSFRDPGGHALGIGWKFELDRSCALEARLADRLEIFIERRVAAAGRHVAMIDAIAIRYMDMGDAALEPLGDVFGRNAHEPEMRNVDCRFHIGKSYLVEKALHR